MLKLRLAQPPHWTYINPEHHITYILNLWKNSKQHVLVRTSMRTTTKMHSVLFFFTQIIINRHFLVTVFAVSHREPKFTCTQKCGRGRRGYWAMHIWLFLCLLAFATAQWDDLTSIESSSLSLIPHRQPRPWPSAHTFYKLHSTFPAGKVLNNFK